ARLPQRTVMAQQYRGSAVDIVYSAESLREIFVNNVRLLKADTMVRPDRLRADPLEAFLGRAHVTHTYTREDEDAFEYIWPPTLAPARGPQDHRPAAGCVAPRRAAARAPGQGGGEPRGERDRLRVPGRDRAPRRRPRPRSPPAPPPRGHPDARRSPGSSTST